MIVEPSPSAAAVLADLESRGLTLRVEGGRLVAEPYERVGPVEAAVIAAWRGALKRALEERRGRGE